MLAKKNIPMLHIWLIHFKVILFIHQIVDYDVLFIVLLQMEERFTKRNIKQCNSFSSGYLNYFDSDIGIDVMMTFHKIVKTQI